MLVLTRKENEEIVFPTLGITIVILNSKNGKARVGIKAPTEAPVLRGELVGKDQPPPESEAVSKAA